ncbi:MAG: RDD family protein [Gammaproteobacteria bacterium]|jgi:uncharacterized RDD family membrane protein YckC
MSPTLLDTARTFETPEGVELQLRVAGPVVRSLAWVLDTLIRVALYIGLSIALTQLGKMGTGIMLVGFFLVEWFYPVFFEVLQYGATPGKKALGIRVVHDNGTPVAWSASIIRNLLRVADFAPLFYGFGIATMLLNRDFKRLGDMAAGTIVIYTPKKIKQTKIPEAQAVAPPLALSITEQRAVMDFAERSHLLSSERQQELANILSDILGHQGEAAIQTLYQYANWLHGTNTSNK